MKYDPLRPLPHFLYTKLHLQHCSSSCNSNKKKVFLVSCDLDSAVAKDFQTSLPDCLHHAIDQLTTRGVAPEEIAEIVEVESEQVESWELDGEWKVTGGCIFLMEVAGQVF